METNFSLLLLNFSAAFNGFVAGVFFVLCAELFFVYRLVVGPSWFNSRRASSFALDSSSSAAKPESRPRTETGDSYEFLPDYAKWPAEIVAYLKRILTRDDSSQPPSDAVTCLNAFVHRYFVECRESEVFKARLRSRLMHALDKRFRPDSAGSLVQSIEVGDISLGDYPPVFDSVRLMRNSDSAESLDVVYETNLRYGGGARVSIVTFLNMGIKIPVSICIQKLAGKMQVRVPSPANPSQYAVGFVTDPGLELLVESSLWRRDNEMLKDVLNSLIARKLKSIFNDLLLLPNWRPFDLPLLGQHRSSDDDAAHASDEPEVESVTKLLTEKLEERKKTFLKQTPSTPLVQPPQHQPVERSDSFPEAYSRRQASTLQVIDIFQHKCSPIYADISTRNLDASQTSLMRQFMRLVLEKDQSASPSDTLESVASTSLDRSFEVDAWISSYWENVRTKKDIVVQKKTVSSKAGKTDVHRGIFKVANCSAQKAYQILRNPEHFRHVEDSFIDSQSIIKFNETAGIRRLTFRFGKVDKIFTVLEVRTKIAAGPDYPSLPADSYVVIYRSAKFDGKNHDAAPRDVTLNRSVSNISDTSTVMLSPHLGTLRSLPRSDITTEQVSAEFAFPMGDLIEPVSPVPSNLRLPGLAAGDDYRSTPPLLGSSSPTFSKSTSFNSLPQDNIGTVFVYGYLIDPIPNQEACTVTCLSQFGNATLQKLDVSYQKCLKTKQFMEELADWSHLVGAQDRKELVDSEEATPARTRQGSEANWKSFMAYTSSSLAKASRFLHNRAKGQATNGGTEQESLRPKEDVSATSTATSTLHRHSARQRSMSEGALRDVVNNQL